MAKKPKRKVQPVRKPESGRAQAVISPRTVLLAIRREQLASHGSLMARIEFLLGQIR